MAKRLGTTYQPGKRSPNWRKVKNRMQGGGRDRRVHRRHRQPLIHVRLAAGRTWDSDRLAFAGGVGTGFNQRRSDELTQTLRSLPPTSARSIRSHPPPTGVARRGYALS